jgi:hypothetical protein
MVICKQERRASALVRTASGGHATGYEFCDHKKKFIFRKAMTTKTALELTVWEVRLMYSALSKLWSDDSRQCYIEDLLSVCEEKYPSSFGECSSSRAVCVTNECFFERHRCHRSNVANGNTCFAKFILPLDIYI